MIFSKVPLLLIEGQILGKTISTVSHLLHIWSCTFTRIGCEKNVLASHRKGQRTQFFLSYITKYTTTQLVISYIVVWNTLTGRVQRITQQSAFFSAPTPILKNQETQSFISWYRYNYAQYQLPELHQCGVYTLAVFQELIYQNNLPPN